MIPGTKTPFKQFTRLWQKDYLLSLRENQKARFSINSASKISLGDVVVLKDDSTSRAFWKLPAILSCTIGQVHLLVYNIGVIT